MNSRRKSPPPSPPPPPASVPDWLRRAARAAKTPDEIALAAGTALGALDQVVRRQEVWAGVWRQRLALGAALVSLRRAGRAVDEAALRDAVMFTRPGDDPGPAGAILRVWQRLAARPITTLAGTGPGIGAEARVLCAAFGAGDKTVIGAVEALLRAPQPQPGATAGGIVAALEAVFSPPEAAVADAAPWLADLRLAQALGWRVAVPLLGTQPPARNATANVTIPGLLQAQTRAALKALDLAVDLGRRAERLLAVAPGLRAKGAGAVLERLLAEDALTAAHPVPGISERGLRRLFDRLTDLGALRELSGRAAFRIYGL